MPMLTVRQVAPEDKAWLQAEAERRGVSMEALVRDLISTARQKSQSPEQPSDIIGRLFGPEHGVDLGERASFGFRPTSLDDAAE